MGEVLVELTMITVVDYKRRISGAYSTIGVRGKIEPPMTMISKKREVETAVTVLSCLSSNVSKYKEGPSRAVDVKFQEEQDYGERLRLSLDALAKICLCDAQGQVIATTISITQTQNLGRVELFISANTKATLQPSLVDYIESVWASLKEISRSHFNKPPRLEDSPPSEVLAVNDLGAKVYQRCSVKWLQILKKRFEQFQRFSAFINQREGAPPESFTQAQHYVNTSNTIASKPSPPWAKLAPALNAVFLRLSKVLEQDLWLSSELEEYRRHIIREYRISTVSIQLKHL
jgi:hypothetical protein